MYHQQIPEVLWSPPSGCAMDRDCACPDSILPSQEYRLNPDIRGLPFQGTLGLWKLPESLYRVPLPEHHELVLNAQNSVGVVVLNALASRVLDSFSKPNQLYTSTERQLAALRLLSPQDAVDGQTSLQELPQTLTVWLHLTDACNLRCAYCYVPRSCSMMSEETGIAAVDAVFRSALANGFHTVKLKYAGGEPTLNWPLIPLLHAHAKAQAEEHSIALCATLLSNGTTLTQDMLYWLRREDVRLMISLDGVGAVQDAQRPFADGGGSFARVAGNIDQALDLGVTPYLSITVTPQSVSGLPDVVAFALERGLQFNFNFVRAPMDPADEWAMDSKHLIDGVKAAFALIETALPRYPLVDALLDRTLISASHLYPCGAGHNYMVIDAQGRVARCQMELDTPVVDIRSQDPLQVLRKWDQGFQNVSVDEKAGCRECPWRYYCAGGCPLLTYRTIGSVQAPSLYCEVYKALFPELLRLEGLRLLKWHSMPS